MRSCACSSKSAGPRARARKFSRRHCDAHAARALCAVCLQRRCAPSCKCAHSAHPGRTHKCASKNAPAVSMMGPPQSAVAGALRTRCGCHSPRGRQLSAETRAGRPAANEAKQARTLQERCAWQGAGERAPVNARQAAPQALTRYRWRQRFRRLPAPVSLALRLPFRVDLPGRTSSFFFTNGTLLWMKRCEIEVARELDFRRCSSTTMWCARR